MLNRFLEKTSTHDIVTVMIVAVAILTLVMATAACLHVLGRIKIRPPYADWLVGTLLFGMLGSAAFAVNARFRAETAPPVTALKCETLTLDAITDQSTFAAAIKTPECRALIDGWMTAASRFDVTDARLVNALVNTTPTRKTGETDLDWFNRVRDAAEVHPVVGPLRKRARERDAPFQPSTEQMRIGRSDSEHDVGLVRVSRGELDGQLLQVSSDARRHCVLRLRATYKLFTATSEIPLFHLNTAQRIYLLGTSSINDPSGVKPGRFTWARSGESAFDPSDSGPCSVPS